MATVTAQRAAALKKIIYLNFDLNRTVLMSDAAGGRSMEDTVNYLLSEICYGKVEDNGTQSKWKAVGKAKPYPGTAVPDDKSLVTYKAFGDKLYGYKSGGTAEDVAHNKAMKKRRKKLQSSFTNENNPGETFRPYLDQVMKALEMKDQTTRTLAKKAAKGVEPGLLKEFWESGKYFLLPSFLNFLVYLQSNPNILANVRIVYRTFGSDLEEVAKELDVFGEGNHPLFPGVKLDKKLQLEKPYGVFFRNKDGSSGTSLVMGTIDKAPSDCEDLKTFYASQNVEIKNGFQNCRDTIVSQLSALNGTQTLGLRDYWEWWHAHGESDSSGKILIVDDSRQKTEHQCFVDDHVEADHSHIVDVRDVNGIKVPFEKSINVNIFRSEPYLAITERDYFIDMFQAIVEVSGEDSNL